MVYTEYHLPHHAHAQIILNVHPHFLSLIRVHTTQSSFPLSLQVQHLPLPHPWKPHRYNLCSPSWWCLAQHHALYPQRDTSANTYKITYARSQYHHYPFPERTLATSTNFTMTSALWRGVVLLNTMHCTHSDRPLNKATDLSKRRLFFKLPSTAYLLKSVNWWAGRKGRGV